MGGGGFYIPGLDKKFNMLIPINLQISEVDTKEK